MTPSVASDPVAQNKHRLKIPNRSWENRRLIRQPLIHHHNALPIFAAFGLRYVHILVRKWAALGTCGGRAPEVGMRPVEW